MIDEETATTTAARAFPPFFLARVAEDEEVARGGFWAETHPWELGHVCERGCISVDARRVLAECDAKRRILTLHELDRSAYPDTTIESDPCCNECSCGGEYPGGYPCETLRLLALPYADHPEFRDEWRRGLERLRP